MVDSQKKSTYGFACGGWLKSYLFGVAKCLQDLGLDKNSKFVGSSAGALTAAGLALGVNFDHVMEYAKGCIDECHATLMGPLKLRKYVYGCLKHCEEELKDFGKLDGELQVCVTDLLPYPHTVRFGRFRSLQSLKSALVASCTAAPLAGLPFWREGRLVMDGGMCDFHPTFDKDTISVSPFYLDSSDIKPSRYVPLWWAVYPPSKEEFQWVYELGYRDAWVWAHGPTGPLRNQHAADSNSNTSSGSSEDRTHTPPEPPEMAYRPHSKSFSRFFGYDVVDSKAVDFVLTFLVLAVCRPLACALIYWELLGKLFWASIEAVLRAVFPRREKSQTNPCRRANDYMMHLSSLFSLSLFISSIPIVGSLWGLKDHRKEKLERQSFVYRVSHHFLNDN